MKTLVGIGAVLAAVVIFFLGRWSMGEDEGKSQPTSRPALEGHEGHDAEGPAKPVRWTCPMHPQINRAEAGDCPICLMDLVPLVKDDLGPRQFAMSEAARKLASIETTAVEKRFVTVPVRLVGKVDFDETVIKTIAARVPGRLDRLYVDYTGVSVSKGDHLIWLYSPELLTAQEELLEAKRRLVETKGEPSAFLADSNLKAYESAKSKLLLWGLTKTQIEEVETRGKAEDHMMITSPVSGVVIQKALNEGDYVKEGTRIYQIADLQHLWIRLDAYEQDLPWIRYGQSVSIQTVAMPGESFEGWISFVDPVLDPKTRTVKVRVNVKNHDGKLKPGMFVRAIVEARVAGAGRVIDPDLAGKWICPMHPEVVKDGAGSCSICGMPLKPAAELGLVVAKESEKPLVVPVSAVLVTGKRAVVYVRLKGKKRPTYEGREVVLGPRAGDFYIILEGLEEGERVVTRGAFRIDSSLQILAKPSMMSQSGQREVFKGSEARSFRTSLADVYEAYLRVQESLAKDDWSASKTGMEAMVLALNGVQSASLPRRARALWQDEYKILTGQSRLGQGASSIEMQRRIFFKISRALLVVEDVFGHVGEERFFEAYCPMAFDNKGAPWIQLGKEINNPYFGASMLRCGEIRNEFPGLSSLGGNKPAAPASREAKQKVPGPAESKPAVEDRKQVRVETGALDALYPSYFAMQKALAGDDLDAASTALTALKKSIAGITTTQWEEQVQVAWKAFQVAMDSGLEAKGIEGLRKTFEPLSMQLLLLESLVGHGGKAVYFRVHCPMAFDDKGADWIQTGEDVRNPYYGASMLECGSVVKELPAREGR